MTAKELIEELKQLPPDMAVIYTDYEQVKHVRQIIVGRVSDNEYDVPVFISEDIIHGGIDSPADYGLDKWTEEKVALLDG